MSPVGRPKAENPKEVRFSIRLDAETEQQLATYCTKNGVTKGEAIRQGIKLLLEKKKNKVLAALAKHNQHFIAPFP